MKLLVRDSLGKALLVYAECCLQAQMVLVTLEDAGPAWEA